MEPKRARLETDHKTYSSYKSHPLSPLQREILRNIFSGSHRGERFWPSARREEEASPQWGCTRRSNNAGSQKIRRSIRQIDGWLTDT